MKRINSMNVKINREIDKDNQLHEIGTIELHVKFYYNRIIPGISDKIVYDLRSKGICEIVIW